ncbi:hypothetical protein [Colwellia sp. MB3u-55]|nr:hypothetical protein [Colwellia sp. MB3u-55]
MPSSLKLAGVDSIEPPNFHSFEPRLVTKLTTPPNERPYSAP